MAITQNFSSRSLLSVSLRTVLFAAMMGSMVFDYRRLSLDTGGFVVIMGVLSILFAGALILHIRVVSRLVIMWTLPFLLFLVVAILSGVLRKQPLYSVIAASTPVVIFVLSAAAVASYPRTPEDLPHMMNMIVGFALLAAIWKVMFGFIYYGLTISDVRYQVLSGATPLLFAYAVTSFLVHYRRFTITALALSLGIVAISVTRTYLVVFFVSGVAALLCIPKKYMEKTIPRILLGLIALAAVIFAIYLFEPVLVKRWILRLSVRSSFGFDLTGATRLAEANYQITRLRQDLSGLWFGFGMFAETRFSGLNARLVESILGAKGLDYLGHGYGHNFYVGLVYVGGVIAGGLAALTLFLAPIKGAAKARRMRLEEATSVTRFAWIWGVSACAGYIGYGFLGGTFGDRSISLFYGLAMGLLFSRNFRTPNQIRTPGGPHIA